jgi:hypothetical protein
MNLGDRVECGVFTPKQIGLVDRRVQSILTNNLDATTITIGGSPICYQDITDLPVVEEEVLENNNNLVTSGGVFTAIASSASTKQNLLTVNGQPVSVEILSTFALAPGDGVGYSNSLLTAGAIENWFESLQESLLMIPPGQSGPGFRAAVINTASPSAINVPSCLAVSNYVNTQIASASSLPKFVGGGHSNTGKVNNIPVTSLVNLSVSGGIMAFEWNKSTGTMSQTTTQNVAPAIAWVAYDSEPFSSSASDANPIDYIGQSLDSTQFGYNMSGALVTGSVLYQFVSTVIGFPSGQSVHNFHHAAGNGMPTIYQLLRSIYPLGAVYNQQGETMTSNTNSGSLVDETPTLNSTNLVSSRGLFSVLSTKHPLTSVDSTPTLNSTNLVTSGGVRDSLDLKHPLTTIDISPTYDNYNNLVSSGGVRGAIDDAIEALEMVNIGDLPLKIAPNAPGDTTKTIYFDQVATVILPRILLSGALGTDARASFSRFKTTADEILGDSEHAPISDSALLECGRVAVIALTSASGYHLLPPSGATIHTHLSSSYESINTMIPFTSSRIGIGHYQIAFNPQVDNKYTILLSVEASQNTTAGEVDDDYMLSYTDKWTGSFKVIISEQDNSINPGEKRDCRFDFVCFRTGRVICHGSIRGDGVTD